MEVVRTPDDRPAATVEQASLAAAATTSRGRGLIHAFGRYAVVGVLSVIVDTGLLAALHTGLGVELWQATVAAYAAGLVVNYSLNSAWSFAPRTGEGPTLARRDHRRTLPRYAALMAVNVGATVGLVLGLTAAGAFYLAAKAVAVVATGAVNFAGFRWWVFR